MIFKNLSTYLEREGESECDKMLTAVRSKWRDTGCIVLVFLFLCTFVIFLNAEEEEVENSL